MGDGVEAQLAVDGGVTAVRVDERTAPDADMVAILAHGAGGHMDHRTLQWQAAMLLGAAVDVVRFNFLYRAAGRSAPDRMPRLQACYRAVIDWTRAARPGHRLVIGGHSMGGRVASMLAAEGLPCAGLLLFAYPLHPPGQPERRRDGHLADIGCPVLCFNGTRDAFCTADLMTAATAGLSNWRQHWIDAADHGFSVTRRSGRTRADVTAEITAALAAWLPNLR